MSSLDRYSRRIEKKGEDDSLIYIKATLAGLAASFLVVVAILIYESIRAASLARKTHPRELVATAGTYGMALRSPLVQILVVVVFAVGFYIAIR